MSADRDADRTTTWGWAFYFLLVMCSASLDCRLRELHEDLVNIRHAMPARTAEIRAVP